MENSLSIIQAAIISLWCWFVLSRITLATLQLRYGTLMTALVVGIVMGDIPAAMTVGAAVQLVLFNVGGAGGAAAAEPSIATAIAVPVALISNLDPASAAAIAIPIGLLGAYLYQGRFFINTYIMRVVDKHAAQGNSAGLTRSIVGYPLLSSFILIFPIMFIALYLGAPLVAEFSARYIQGTVAHVLSSIGGGLAVTGLVAGMVAIGREKFMIFFVLSYFLAVNLIEINILTWAIIGSVIAAAYIMSRDHDKLAVLAEDEL